jgi:hypothetical protein
MLWSSAGIRVRSGMAHSGRGRERPCQRTNAPCALARSAPTHRVCVSTTRWHALPVIACVPSVCESSFSRIRMCAAACTIVAPFVVQTVPSHNFTH